MTGCARTDVFSKFTKALFLSIGLGRREGEEVDQNLSFSTGRLKARTRPFLLGTGETR